MPFARACATDVPSQLEVLALKVPGHGSSVPDSVLLLEDNVIILMDTEDIVKELGVPVVMTATNCAEALFHIEKTPPALALLDVDLGFENCFDVAAELKARGIFFAFVSGYGDNMQIPAEFADAPRLMKPYAAEALRDLLSKFQ